MSLVHASIVGHFDLTDCMYQRFWPVRPLDPSRVEKLLEFYGPEVAACVSFRDGYAWCEWSPSRHAERVMEFAERLADQEGCVVMETCPPGLCRYPPEAVKRQAE